MRVALGTLLAGTLLASCSPKVADDAGSAEEALAAADQANARIVDLEARLEDLEGRMDDAESSLSSEISDREITDESLERSIQNHYHY